MTKKELIAILEKCARSEKGDREYDHINADDALLTFINDEDIKKAYDSIEKWYA